MTAFTQQTVLIHAAPSCPVGEACSKAFSAAGATVYSTQQGDAPEPFDPLSDAAWAAQMQRLQDASGLDILICCAPPSDATPIVSTDLEQFRTALYDSALAGWLGQQHAIGAMREHGRGGSIVHITSVLARSVSANAAARCAAEAGILMSSKAAALECAKTEDSIVVNTVLAGPIQEAKPDAQLTECPPVGAQDVAAAAVFLASEQASYLTGTELPVDRGFLSR